MVSRRRGGWTRRRKRVEGRGSIEESVLKTRKERELAKIQNGTMTRKGRKTDDGREGDASSAWRGWRRDRRRECVRRGRKGKA